MEEVRQLVQEEGREARNLVAFHVAVDNPAPTRVARRPPRTGAPPTRRPAPGSAARLRSASAGRDKRSELRARYWALLFGDLQRAVGEIYNTVEAHENLNECQEVILVLENYTRDFKALGEWFRLKWEYDNTPPPQRPQSLAWEIRKTDFVRPESRRTHSVKSSPPVSGKNSPLLSGHNTPSGKNSPNLTGKASPASGKTSPRVSGHSSLSPKGSIEFFSAKITSKIATKPEPKVVKETRLSDIKEKEVAMTEEVDENVKNDDAVRQKEEKDSSKPTVESSKSIVELVTAKELPNATPKQVVIKTSKRGKQSSEKKVGDEISSQAKATIAKLDAMENEFLAKQLSENSAKNENVLNLDLEKDKIENAKTPQKVIDIESGTDVIEKENISSVSPTNSEDNFADISNECSKSCDDKDSTAVINPVESKPTQEITTPVTNTKSINSAAKKKDSGASNTAKKEPAINATHETPLKDTKLLESKDKDAKKDSANATPVKKESTAKVAIESAPKDTKSTESKDKDTKKETNKKCTKETKTEPGKKEELAKELRKTEPHKKEDSVKDSKNTEQSKETKKSEHSKKDDSVNDPKNKEHGKEFDAKKLNMDDKLPVAKPQSEQNIDGKDGKKDDQKKVETKLVVETKPTRPAYSQAAAKPKLITAKTEVKTPTRTLVRSKTVVEIRPDSAPNRQRQFINRNHKEKCSYPFNLTTGRTSLFDAPGNKVIATKRPISRPQMSSGDNRNQFKPDAKRPQRPASLKINEKGDKIEKINPALEKIKDCDEYSSSETVVTQIDMSRIESSESLKTIVPDGYDVANSVEVLNVDGDKNDNDGWLTVKSRRLSRESKKSKSHWANRFHQPSTTTSLPTLNMIESPKSETNPIIDSKMDRAKSEQPQNKPEKVVKVVVEPKSEAKVKTTSMIRQKSDVTGLKTRSSRNKALKRDKNKDKKDSVLTKNRLHSSLESLTTGLARSQESTEEDAFDFDKWKAEFMTTFKYLEESDDQMTNDSEILKTADPSEMSEIAEMTSQIEENERKISLALDFQSEADQKKLCQEEDLLNRQIMELQQVSDIDMDTETDDTETDAEILCDDSAIVRRSDSLTWHSLASCLENQYESALAGMTWAERVDMLGALEALVARDPGRAQQLHAKLSQGIKRRGSLQDVLRRLQAKQARAETQRKQLHTERAKKIHQLLARVEEVKMAKNQLIDEKRLRMERRLQKAAENRDQHLKDIVRKAHDEEEKLREIAFIKQLEAENRRHEFLDQCRSLTTRLREVRRERFDKLEQKAAREAAVGARRQALEAARKQHVENLLEKRKERDARVEELKEREKKERDDAAREKAEGVKSRLSALAAAAELEADALRSRIRDKQDASQQRLESHLQAIREKATGPRQPTTSESQDQITKETTKEEDEEVAKLEQERKERERQKALRKKARKLKLKILATSKDAQIVDNRTLTKFLNPIASKMHKVVNQISNLISPLLYPDNGLKTANNFEEKRKKQKLEPIENNNIDFRYDFEEKINKKRKKKKASEQKLSKSDSICSSMSDMSKASGKIERALFLLDMQVLEKLISELYRILGSKEYIKESSEHQQQRPTSPESTILTKLLAVKTLGNILTILAERDEIMPQMTTKAMTTLVMTTTRVITTCRPTALYLFSTAAAAHCVTLLYNQLEKDLSDAKEMELARHLTDLISVTWDAALCESRLHAEGDVAGVRARAHSLVSYLCMSGCIARAQHAGDARESMQTLLTLCADLCKPHTADTGPERTSAVQSLRCALGTSIIGSREEFCMLFAEGAELSRSKSFVRAARTTHLLRALAELDHQFVQDAFGEGGWPLEFRAAVARLLSQHAPSDKEAPKTDSLHLSNQRLDHSLSETMVLDLIVLVGFVVVNNPQLHETICENWGVIKTLCTLPANWLVSTTHCHSLLPTLVALADRPGTADVIASELSLKMLDQYMKNPESLKVKLIQVLKQGRDKAAKKGKREKTNDSNKENDLKNENGPDIDCPNDDKQNLGNKNVINGDIDI